MASLRLETLFLSLFSLDFPFGADSLQVKGLLSSAVSMAGREGPRQALLSDSPLHFLIQRPISALINGLVMGL